VFVKRILSYTIQLIIAVLMFTIMAVVVTIGSFFVFLLGFYQFSFDNIVLDNDNIYLSLFDHHGRNFWNLMWRVVPLARKKS
jgi:hypothetical protein